MTNAELAVLSLLVEKPRHGYEIQQVIEERGMREWTEIGFSSIYYVLSKLEKQGLVQAREETAGGGPARKVYSPTADGLRASGEATVEALSAVRPAPMPFLLGLSNIVGLPEEEARAALESYREDLTRRLAQVEARRAAVSGAPEHVSDLFDYSVTMIEAERDWVSGLLERRYASRRGHAHRGKERKMPRKLKTDPEIVEMPARKMAVVRSVGDPNEVGEKVFKALYGSAYTLKFDLKKRGVEFKMEAPRARWFEGENWQEVPREQWRAAWALPVPDDTTELPQKEPEPPVELETWEYGTVAQILHIGTYAEEEPAIRRLHEFIAEQGYEIVGPHEEEYISRPGSKEQKTRIRYQVRKA